MATSKYISDCAITQKAYWKEITDLAKQAHTKEDYDDDAEVSDIVHELVDGHQWVIYTCYNPFVLIHSKNEDALFDAMGDQAFASYGDVMMKMAYYAMAQDVFDEIGDLE